jgi:hypothetical protein
MTGFTQVNGAARRDSSNSPTKLKLPQKIFQSPSASPIGQPRPTQRLKNEDSKNLFSPILEQDQETSNVQMPTEKPSFDFSKPQKRLY